MQQRNKNEKQQQQQANAQEKQSIQIWFRFVQRVQISNLINLYFCNYYVVSALFVVHRIRMSEKKSNERIKNEI